MRKRKEIIKQAPCTFVGSIINVLCRRQRTQVLLLHARRKIRIFRSWSLITYIKLERLALASAGNLGAWILSNIFFGEMIQQQTFGY